VSLSFGLQEALLILSAESQLIEDFEGLIEILWAVSYRPEQHDIAVEVREVLVSEVTLLHLAEKFPGLGKVSGVLRMLLKFGLAHDEFELGVHRLGLPHLDFRVLLRLVVLLGARSQLHRLEGLVELLVLGRSLGDCRLVRTLAEGLFLAAF
jgi:hypothetical protein